MTCIFGFYYLGMAPDYFNHTQEGYTEPFHSLVQDMDEYYILKEWKEVDFASLEKKYMPMVREAEQEQSEEKFADAVMMFCCELHDGHVPMIAENSDRIGFASYTLSYKPKEYGLAMVQLDNDDVIAVCTTDDVHKLGIEDGTVMFRAYRHFEKLGTEDADQSLMDENFSAKMLDDKCGYLRVTTEGTDNGFYDIFVGYMMGDHAKAREMFREKLRGLKAQGMEYLVVDLRNNQGGLDEIANALCDLLTTEDQNHYGVGIRKIGSYDCIVIHGIHGDGAMQMTD